jgi:photosynthetic reaction center cytochrome c subunit
MSKSTIVALMLFAAAAAAAEPAKTTEQQYKNIQVLKGVPAVELDGAMGFISASLGVGCDYCHVQAGPDKDDKKTKKVARKMITMADKINHDFFGGNQVVTCATCHAGRPEPLATPPLEKPRAPSTEGKPPALTAQQIFDQFTQATGGKAWAKLRTRVASGSFAMEGRPPFALEVVQSAPNRMLSRLTIPGVGAFEQVFDGKSGWRKSPRGVESLSPGELAQAARDAPLAVPLALSRGLSDVKVAADEPVDGAPAHVVEGKRGPLVERLFFDGKNGLLLRRITRTPTVLGELLEETRFEDYRVVDGVKLPFTVVHNGGGESRSEKFTTIQHNQPVDDKAFVRPSDQAH